MPSSELSEGSVSYQADAVLVICWQRMWLLSTHVLHEGHTKSCAVFPHGIRWATEANNVGTPLQYTLRKKLPHHEDRNENLGIFLIAMGRTVHTGTRGVTTGTA